MGPISHTPFARDGYRVPLIGGGALTPQPPDQAAADAVAQAMREIDPWRTLQSRPEQLSEFLLRADPQCCRRIIRLGGAIAGVVAVRSPWLLGPYLSLLAVLPSFQGAGVGSAILGW